MNMETRPLRTEDVVLLARQQAEAGERMSHHFEPGSREAIAFERAYLERQRELDHHEG